MRAHVTTKSRLRRSARNRVLALAIGACALAIPASAAAYSSPNAITGGSEQSTPDGSSQTSVNAITQASSGSSAPGAPQSAHRVDPQYSSVNAIAPPGSQSGAPRGADSRLSSLNAIAGPRGGAPTAVSSSPADTGDGFHWGDAALGAGAAMALVALGGAAMFTARRRTTVSPA